MAYGTSLTKPGHMELWAEHTAQEFVHKDVDASLATMVADPHVICVPVGTGGRDGFSVREFYSKHFVGQTPQNTRLELLSRTEGKDRIVDEMLISFTHDIEMPWMLPGIAPTGREVEVPFVAIIEFRDGKIASEHLFWDQATVLVQIGKLTSSDLPVLGAEQAKVLVDPARTLNALLTV